MIDTPSPAPAGPDRYRDRRRVSRPAWALAIVVHIVVIGLLIFQKSPTFVKMSEQGLTAILLPAAADGVDRSKSETKKQQRETQKRVQADTPPPPPAATPPPPEVQAPSNLKMPFIELSSADFAASNISRLPSQRRSTGEAQADSKAPYGPGAAPGGGSLYPADWYREPTDSELAFYLKPTQPSKGWGQIACKTIERFKVDECYILGESPMGSGFGRSVLNAAWQFMVRPPRVNGKSQVGTWVSIRITYSPDDIDIKQGG